MLTDIGVTKATPYAQRREIPDGKIVGLYLVVQPSGAKSWALRYRVAGKPVKLTMGSYPAVDLATARRKALEALGAVAGGGNPAEEKQAVREARRVEQTPSDRVQAVGAAFIDKYVARTAGEKWARESARLIEKEINPRLGSKRLSDVKKSDIHDLLDDIVDRGSPIVANRVLAVFRRLCNWSIERGLIDVSPCEKVKAPSVEVSRDRVLTDDELRLAWVAFDRAGWPFGPLAKLLLLTGARRDEVASATWSEFDLKEKTWTIPKERSKNGQSHEVPLSDGALRVLTTLPRIEGGPRSAGFVFTTNGKSAVSGFSKAKTQFDAEILDALRERAGEPPNAADDVEALPRWTLHDLRRTAASGMAGLGIAPHVVEAVLNHKSGTIKGVAAVYNRYSYNSEKRAALDAWGLRLDAIVSGAHAR